MTNSPPGTSTRAAPRSASPPQPARPVGRRGRNPRPGPGSKLVGEAGEVTPRGNGEVHVGQAGAAPPGSFDHPGRMSMPCASATRGERAACMRPMPQPISRTLWPGSRSPHSSRRDMISSVTWERTPGSPRSRRRCSPPRGG